MKLCNLYGCNKATGSQHEKAHGWRAKYCCLNHSRQHSGKCTHNRQHLPNQTKSEFLEYISDYTIAKQKRTAQATPKWANKKAIRDVYIEARRLTAETETIYEVDHIIPLTNKLVCGLHVESNLQIITITQNRSKHNKFEV